MSKRVQTPTGPLAPPDNPPPHPSTSTIPQPKLVGKFHQYPPVDMVDPETHRVPEGGTVGEGGQFVGTEIISPNEMKAIKTAGLHASVHEAYMLQQRRNLALDQMSVVPTEIGLNILAPSVPSDGISVEAANTQEAQAIFQSVPPSLDQNLGPPSHTDLVSAAYHLPRLEAGVLADNFDDNPDPINKVEDWVDNNPLAFNNNPQEGNGLNLSCVKVVQSACNIHIHWDEFGGISEISTPTREVAELMCSKLRDTLSNGKDSIAKAIADGNTDDAAKILEAAEFDALQGYEGYSRYDSLEAFHTLHDPRIGLSELEIANLCTVNAAILSAGPGTQHAVSKGEWPLILNRDLWFRYLISSLTGAARAGSRFKDLPSMGDFPLNAADLVLADDIAVPATQTELVKRLLKQLYAQFDERNDYEALHERSKHIQDGILEKFEWLVRARVGVKCAFLSEYVSEDILKDIMERILMEEPRPELTQFIRESWRKQGALEAEKERGRVVNQAYQEAIESHAIAGRDLAAAHAGHYDKGDLEVQRDAHMREISAAHDKAIKDLEETYANEYRVQKQARSQWYNQLDEADQAAHIRKEALALGLIEPEELQAPAGKKARPSTISRSGSVTSAKKRGCLVSRSDTIEYVNKFAPPHPLPPKAKDGSITPTKASGRGRATSAIRKVPSAPGMKVDVPVPTTPHIISRTMTPLPPAPAELPPAVIPQPMDTREDTKSPSPAVSDTTSDIVNMKFRGIEHTLLLILNRIERLEAKGNPTQAPTKAPSPSPPPIPSALKGKGRAEPMIPLPVTSMATVTKPIGKSLMAQVGEATMRAAGASEEDIKEQVALVDQQFPALNPSTNPKTGLTRPLFTTVVAKNPSDGFKPVQKKATTTLSKLANRFVRAGIATSTEITISRNGGLSGAEEEIFQRSTPAESIVREAQLLLNQVSVSAPRIIKGRFSTRAATNGNFVYTIQGRFSPKEIQGFENCLCAPFPGASIAVPADGWMFAHLRSVPTKDNRGNVWSQSDLYDALEENECFQGICLTVPPRWLHDDFVTGSMEKATVTFAYIDDDSTSVTKKAQKSKIAMFGEFVPFIPVGDKAVSQQCTRCWKLGHIAKYCSSAVEICFVCGGSHDGTPHNFHCPSKSHKVMGVCDCKVSCLVCKQDGHSARSIKCPLKPNVPIPKNFWSKVKRGMIDPVTGFDIPQTSQPKKTNKTISTDKISDVPLAVQLRRKLIREAITSPCKNDANKNNLQCLCCAGPSMGGWSLLYDNPSEARFADILGLDEKTADNIIRAAKQVPTSDSEDSVYTRFSRIRARIVGNDAVKFNRDGKLLSEEELAIEEQLGTSIQDLNRWNETSFTSPIFDKSKLTPTQREWFESVFHSGHTVGISLC